MISPNHPQSIDTTTASPEYRGITVFSGNATPSTKLVISKDSCTASAPRFEGHAPLFKRFGDMIRNMETGEMIPVRNLSSKQLKDLDL